MIKGNDFDIRNFKMTLNEDNVDRIDFDLQKICHINKLELDIKVEPKNISKTFNDLKAGDTIYVWWLNKLYDYKINVVEHIKYVYEDQEIKGEYDLAFHTEDGREFFVNNSCRGSKAFIYGHDGWHEYKIFGTSKKDVKQRLVDTLASDERIFNKNRNKWLKEFE